MAYDKKRKRAGAAASSSSQEPEDSFTFRSLEHQIRHRTKILNRNFVQERAIVLKAGEYPEIWKQVRIRGWETLVSYPKPAYQALVKEFYANAYEDEKFVSYVRGQWIHFDPKSLNDFLKARIPKACEYVLLKTEKGNAQKLLETLCRPGAQWSLNKKKNEPRKLNSTDLKPIPKAWSTFVHHTLLPCANDSDVIVQRAQLVYAIVTGLEIDVGRLIAHNIQEIANDKTATLGYASLITQLCLDAGVEVGQELLIKPTAPITVKYIQKCTIGAEQPPAPPPPPAEQPRRGTKQQQPPPCREKESLSLEKRMQRVEQNVGALCKLAIMILQSQQSLQTMVRYLGEQLHLDVYTMGGLPLTPVTEADILAQINFDAMESDSKERPAEAGPSHPPQEPREEDELEDNI